MSEEHPLPGTCAFCGREFKRAGMTRHLAACQQRAEAISTAARSRRRAQRLLHLQVRDAWGGDFWLHLEIDGAATMGDLDEYLREIWLECCGHLSTYYIGPAWQGEEVGMERRAGTVLSLGLEVLHLYDFGTTSETKIRVVDERRGKSLTEYPIYLMARNNPPDVRCTVCGEAATYLCVECMYEEDPYLFCEEHAEMHEHWEDSVLPIVNSPRVGMCGYCGPAEPPY